MPKNENLVWDGKVTRQKGVLSLVLHTNFLVNEQARTGCKWDSTHTHSGLH